MPGIGKRVENCHPECVMTVFAGETWIIMDFIAEIEGHL